MTFEEWWETEGRKWEPSGQSNVAWMAWEAATTAERERCANVCDQQAEDNDTADEYLNGFAHGAAACAEIIRVTP